MADPTFQIPKEIINPIIQASVNEAVLKALDGPHNIVTKAILDVLQTKVGEDGKPSNYNSGRPWIDWVIGDCIKIAARKAVEAALADKQEHMKAELIKQLSAKRSPLVKQLAEAMVKGVSADAIKYRLNVTFAAVE